MSLRQAGGSRRSSACAFAGIAEFVDVFHDAAPRYRQAAAILGKQRVHQIPQDVIDRHVAFLDPVDAVALHDQAMIEPPSRAILPPSLPAKPMVDQADLLRLGKSGQQIFGISAGGKPDQAVAGPRLGDQLAHEDVAEADIVADRRQHRDVGGQVDRGQRRAAGGDRMQEFHGEMRGIAARAAIAHAEQSAARR